MILRKKFISALILELFCQELMAGEIVFKEKKIYYSVSVNLSLTDIWPAKN